MALLEKSISDANATLKTLPDASFAKSVEEWLSVMEHSAEHYGTKDNVLDCSLLHVAEFRHAPAEVAPLHGIRAKAQCSLVGGQRFFIPPEPA